MVMRSDSNRPNPKRSAKDRFKHNCEVALKGGEDDGRFWDVGWLFASGLEHEAPACADEHEWPGCVAILCELINDQDHEAIWMWFSDHFPDYRMLVPEAEWKEFVTGIVDAYDDGEVGNF